MKQEVAEKEKEVTKVKAEASKVSTATEELQRETTTIATLRAQLQVGGVMVVMVMWCAGTWGRRLTFDLIDFRYFGKKIHVFRNNLIRDRCCFSFG